MIPNRERFDSLGQLRNGLQHFAPVAVVDASEETLRFVFEVIDPFISDCWSLFAIDYDEDYESYIYFLPGTRTSRNPVPRVSRCGRVLRRLGCRLVTG